MKRFSAIVLLILSAALSLGAQEYALEVKNDKKIIYVHRLGLPENTPVLEVIKMMPELLTREGTYIVSSYSVQVEGMSVGGANDAFVAQLRIADVEKIELSQSASDNYTKNGEAGSINIVLAKPKDAFAGTASLDASSPTDIMSGIGLNYAKGGWRVAALFKAEYYDPYENIVEVSYSNGLTPSFYTTDDKSFVQTGMFFLEHKNSKHEFKLSVGEDSENSENVVRNASTTVRSFNGLAKLKYKQIISPRTDFLVEGQYAYRPQRTVAAGTESASKSNGASAHVELSQSAIKKENAELKFKAGANYNYNILSTASSAENSHHVMPYFKAESRVDIWNFLAELDYNWFNYSRAVDGLRSHGDFAGILSNTFQLTPNRMVRLLGEARIVRQNSFTLNPIKIYGASVDYIANGTAANGEWIANLGLSYVRVKDVFSSTPGAYDNSSIYNLEGMAQYRVGFYTVEFTGNVYHARRFSGTDLSSSGIYWNLGLKNSFNFRYDIHAHADLVYNSKVFFLNSDYGDSCYTRLILGKDWRNLNFYCYALLNLRGKTTDTTVNSNVYTYETYAFIRDSIGGGFRVSF